MGMFFKDFDLGPKLKDTNIKVLPPIPNTGWTTPKEFPNLASAKVLGFDVETREPDFDHGPGWARGKGHIVGMSLSAMDALGNIGAWYFPMRHTVEPWFNIPPQHVVAWAKPYLENPHVPKVGANLMYDVGWAREEGIKVAGDLHDVQFAEALLDNDAKVALQVLAMKYCGIGKGVDLMYQWIQQAYKPHKGDERGEIWRTSPRLVGYYGEQDAVLPLQIIQKQWPAILEQGLYDVYRMECDLIYLLVEMRRAGVQVDLSKAESLYEQLGVELKVLYAKLSMESGRTVTSVDSAEELAPILDKFGIKYELTEKTKKPSINKDFFEKVEHPIADMIQAIRKIEKIRNTFIKSYILESHVNGKVHGQYHPLRGEGGGTITGRLSSSDPNLTNIPKRSQLGKKMRAMFQHDFDHEGTMAGDYSQIEYRMLVHHAVGPGSEEVRLQYNTDPKTDYHKMTQSLVKEIGGVFIPRNADEMAESGMNITIKEINFGLCYGMMEGKLGRQAGLDKSTTAKVFAAYHSAAPYVKATMDHIQQEVYDYGYITTISGRRTRFNTWECKDRNYNEEYKTYSIEQAINLYGTNIQRAYAYRGVNYKLQGGAADIIKRAMWRCWKDGIYDVIGVPRLTVHDENMHSVIDWGNEQRDAYGAMIWTMENSTKLLIPVRFDAKTGNNWGEC